MAEQTVRDKIEEAAGVFMMPANVNDAALQFFVEAMKANTKVLEGVQAQQTEVLRDVSHIKESLARIDGQNWAQQISTLNSRVEALLRDKDKRDGAATALSTLWKNLPSIAAVVVSTVLLVLFFLKATGKI